MLRCNHFQACFHVLSRKIQKKNFSSMNKLVNFFQIRRWRIINIINIVDLQIRSLYQRIRYGYAFADCWSLDDAICEFALPRLKHLRNNLHGHPMSLTSVEEWQKILDEIIWMMHEHLHAYNDDSDLYAIMGYDKEDEASFAQVDDTPEQRLILAKYDERLRKASELFGIYFLNLWD